MWRNAVRMAMPCKEQHLSAAVLATQDLTGRAPVGRIDELRALHLEAAQLSQAGAADDGMDSHGYSLKEKGSVNQVGGLERDNGVKPTRILIVLSSALPTSAHTRKRRDRKSTRLNS